MTAIDATMSVLIALTQALPVGTNLALLHFLWMLVSGALLPARGAVFPALQSLGLSAALPDALFGIVGEVGDIDGQRLACPRAFERVVLTDPREQRLWEILLTRLGRTLAADEAVVVDAGVKIGALQAAKVAALCGALAQELHRAAQCRGPL